jgi:hypothetical protein
VGEIAGFDEAAGGLIYLKVKAGEVFVRDRGAIDLDALVDADQMGRGVKAGPVTCRGKDAGQCGRR